MGCGASSQSEQTALSTRPLPTQHPAGVTTLSPHPPAAAFRYPTVDERSTSASPPFLDGGDSNTPQHLQQPSSRRSSSRQQQQQRLSAQDTQISLHLQGARPPQPHPPFTSSNNSLGATPSRHLLFGSQSALPSPSSSSHHHHLRTDDDEYSSRDQVHHSRSATPLSSASGFRSSMLDGVGNHMELHRHQSLGSTAPSEFGGMMGGVGSSRSTTVGGATTASLQQVTLMNPVSSSSPASAVGLLLGVVVGASGNSSSVGGRGGTVNSFAPIDPSGFDPPLLEDVVADDFLRTSMPGSSSASSRTTRKNENDDLRSSSSTATATNATAPPPPNNAATTAKSVHCPQTAYSLANVSPRMTALKTMTTTSSVSPPRQHLHQRSVSNPLQQGATATAIVETTITTTTTTATTESASTTTFSPTTAVPPPFSSQGVFHFNSNNDNSPTLSFQPPNGSFDAFRLSPQQTSLHSNPQQQRRLSTSSPSLVGVSEKRPDDQNALISVLPPRRGSGGDQQQRHHQPPPRSKHQFNKDSPLPTNSTSSLWGRRSGGTNPAHSASNGASAAPAAQLPEAGAAAATALSPLVAGGVGFPSTNSSIKSSPSSSNRNVPPENLPFVNPQSPSSSRKLVVGNGSFSSSATSTIANHCELSHLQFSQFGGGLFNPQEQNDEISDGGGGVASGGGGAGGGISCEDLITSQQKSAAQPPATAQTTASPSRHQPLRTTPKAAKNTVHVPNHHHHHPQGSKYEQHNNSEVYGADDDGDNDDDELQSSGHSLNSRKKSLPGGTLVAPGGDKEDDDDVSEHNKDVDEATTAEAANRQHLILPHITKKLSHRNPGGGGGHTPLDPEDFDDVDVTTHQPLDGEEEPEGEQKGKSNEIGGISYNKENRASVANFAPSSSGAKAMTHQHRLQRGAAHSIRGDVDSESNLSHAVLLLPHAHSEGGIVVVVGGQLQPTTSGSDAPPIGAAAPAAAALPPLSSPFRPLNFLQLNPQSMSSLISGESVGAPTWPTTAIEID